MKWRIVSVIMFLLFFFGCATVSKEKESKYGYIDKTGEFVIKPLFDNARPFRRDLQLLYRWTVTRGVI